MKPSAGMAFRLIVNGQVHEVDVLPGTPLLWVLRDELRLTGTKFGCGFAQCGACTVHLDGQPVRTCVLPVERVGDRAITTIEGLEGPEADALRAEWVAREVPQCGYCQSGQLMTATALLREIPRPSRQTVDQAFAGNICRCATYGRIRAAVIAASEHLEEAGDRE